MYDFAHTDAKIIVSAIMVALLCFQVPVAKVRGQCHDGCSTIAGKNGGVAAQIQVYYSFWFTTVVVANEGQE